MLENIYNPENLTAELQDAGLPVAGVSSAGRIDYTRELTKSERTKELSICNAHDPLFEPELSRLQKYNAAGITIEDLVFALWDQVVKGDNSKATDLQISMKSIDSRIN